MPQACSQPSALRICASPGGAQSGQDRPARRCQQALGIAAICPLIADCPRAIRREDVAARGCPSLSPISHWRRRVVGRSAGAEVERMPVLSQFGLRGDPRGPLHRHIRPPAAAGARCRHPRPGRPRRPVARVIPRASPRGRGNPRSRPRYGPAASRGFGCRAPHQIGLAEAGWCLHRW